MRNVWKKTVFYLLITSLLVIRHFAVKNGGTKNKENNRIYSRKYNRGCQYA